MIIILKTIDLIRQADFIDIQTVVYAAAASQEIIRHIDSQTLLGSESRIVILHQGQRYILRQTQAGKLNLTK